MELMVIEQHKNFFEKIIDKEDIPNGVDHLYLGICYLKLGKLNIAQQLFEKAFSLMVFSSKFWKDAAEPTWLVNTWVLSGKMGLIAETKRELVGFRNEKVKSIANSLLAQYSYGLVELLDTESSTVLQNAIPKLKKDPKIKDMFAIGNAFQAILDRDASVFYDAIDNLLLAHKGKAKHGILRETPEGFLCLPAMSLAFAGYRHGITTKVDNEYFSNEYLALLIHSDMDRSTGKL